MNCDNCFFYCNCALTPKNKLLNSKNLSNNSTCDYFNYSKKILTRYGVYYGVEILSKPLVVVGNTMDNSIYFKNLSLSGHKVLLISIIDKIMTSKIKSGCCYFINIERLSILDSEIIFILVALNSFLNSFDAFLNVIITERNPELCQFTKEAKFQLNDAGIKVTLGKFEINHFDLSCIRLYDGIRFDLKYILTIKDVWPVGTYSDFVSFLYNLVEMGISAIVTNIETREDFDFVLNLPISHLQGPFFNTDVIDSYGVSS